MPLRYIDLCSGIGGFHQAVDRISEALGVNSECVFSSDIDRAASNIYEHTYGIPALFDLTVRETMNKIENAIGEEPLDLICGGFPCQSFSHAGNQEGFHDDTKGILFFRIAALVAIYRPKIILLENVRNLKHHDDKKTYGVILNTLTKMGYYVDDVIMGPDRLEQPIPALRDRIYIMCYRNDILDDVHNFYGGVTPQRQEASILINGVLNQDFFVHDEDIPLSENQIDIINMWNDFRNRIINNGGTMISPIWLEYFADQIDYNMHPLWKQKIIARNQRFYRNNREIYEEWRNDYNDLLERAIPSNRKFEWNAGTTINNIWEGIIQFRPSGVRVKRPDKLPTFVAITQTPILGMEGRYITPHEMSLIYGFRNLDLTHQPRSNAYKQMGNTVSVDVVYELLTRMLNNCNFQIEEGEILWGER